MGTPILFFFFFQSAFLFFFNRSVDDNFKKQIKPKIAAVYFY